MSWTRQADKSLVEWTHDGLSASQIAEKLGLTRNAVCGRRFRLGIRGEGQVSSHFSKDDVEKIASMRRQGKTAGEIGRALGRSEGSIYVKISKMGLARKYTKRQTFDAIVEALRPFAWYFDLNDCKDRSEDDALEVPIRDLRVAFELFEAMGLKVAPQPDASVGKSLTSPSGKP